MMTPMPEPTGEGSDPKGLLLDYLDYFRSVVTAKVDGMTDEQLRGSTLPSGWTPLELLTHLVHMEQRWLRWGFAAEEVDDPWGDSQGSSDGRWKVEPVATLGPLLTRLRDGGRVTTRVDATAWGRGRHTAGNSAATR